MKPQKRPLIQLASSTDFNELANLRKNAFTSVCSATTSFRLLGEVHLPIFLIAKKRVARDVRQN